MRTKYMLLLLVAACIMGCRKDKPTPAPVATIAKIKSETNVATGQTYNYTYDNQGRITRIDKPSGFYEAYTYTSAKLTWAEYSAAGEPQYRKYYELNSEGLATKATYDDPIYLTTYTYNSDKQLLKSINYENGLVISTEDYFYTNKQLDSVVNKSPNSLGYSTIAYEYYDNMESTLSKKNYGHLYLGEVTNKAVKKTSIITYTAAGVVYPNNSYTISNVYEMDAQNRIVKTTSTVVRTTGTTTGSTTYLYY